MESINNAKPYPKKPLFTSSIVQNQPFPMDKNHTNIKKPMYWSPKEDKILLQKAKENNYKNWMKVASFLPGRTPNQCSARYIRIQPGLNKGLWNEEEDKELLKLYNIYGKNWKVLAKHMPKRTGKQIRDRFINALDLNLNKGGFQSYEDNLILKWYKVYGNAWTKIAKQLTGRSGVMVKCRYRYLLKNKLKVNNEENNFLSKKRKMESNERQDDTETNSSKNDNSIYVNIEKFRIEKSINEIFIKNEKKIVNNPKKNIELTEKIDENPKKNLSYIYDLNNMIIRQNYSNSYYYFIYYLNQLYINLITNNFIVGIRLNYLNRLQNLLTELSEELEK